MTPACPPARTWAPLVLLALILGMAPTAARGQEGVFLREDEAARAVFPATDRVQREEVPSSPVLREHMTAHLGGITPSVWEERYVVFRAEHGSEALGSAIIVEEIGKHRPITFVVGVRTDGTVEDVAVMAYREAYGGDVRRKRFLKQYRGKRPGDGLRTSQDITNIAGATLSVEAAGRAVRKALALAAVLDSRVAAR